MTDEKDLIWNRLLELVESEISPAKSLTISRLTDLVDDLNLVGDDADDFMGKFAEKFSVEAGDFDFNDYFPPEGFNPFAAFGGLVADKFKGKMRKPITLEMLEKAAQIKIWDSAKIESASSK